jgi:hypothetical protein
MANKTKFESKPIIPIAKSKGRNSHKIFPERTTNEVERLKKEKLLFSFHFLDTDHKAFNCGKTEPSWFMHLMYNLREISKLNRFEFTKEQSTHYGVHNHDFSKTAHHYNESVSEETLEQISEGDMIQFRLSSSGGRVHGFLIHNTFYILWLDRHHNLYPDQRFGGAKFYEQHLTPYQELEIHYGALQEKYKQLEKDSEEIMAELIEKETKLEALK